VHSMGIHRQVTYIPLSKAKNVNVKLVSLALISSAVRPQHRNDAGQNANAEIKGTQLKALLHAHIKGTHPKNLAHTLYFAASIRSTKPFDDNLRLPPVSHMFSLRIESDSCFVPNPSYVTAVFNASLVKHAPLHSEHWPAYVRAKRCSSMIGVTLSTFHPQLVLTI